MGVLDYTGIILASVGATVTIVVSLPILMGFGTTGIAASSFAAGI